MSTNRETLPKVGSASVGTGQLTADEEALPDSRQGSSFESITNSQTPVSADESETSAVSQPADELPADTSDRSDWQRATDTSGVMTQTHIGGQALLEGIMMRGRYNWAIAVRRPDGSIYTEEHDLVSGKQKNSWMYWPIIRGCTALVESLTLGYQSIQIAAENAFEDDSDEPDLETAEITATDEAALMDAPDDEERQVGAGVSPDNNGGDGETGQAQAINDSPKPAEDEIPAYLITVGIILGVLLGMGIFIALPAFITNLIVGEYGQRTIIWNLVDGALRLGIFVVYIYLIGKMADIKRMFGYHGAEHRTIHCFEHGLPLTPENANRFPSLHVRCGTAFMLMTMIIAIIVFTIVPISTLINALNIQNGILRFVVLVLCRILLVPVIGGLSYEVTVKWAGSHPDHPLVKVVLWPGMQMQRLTTNTPDVGMLECAIVAMQLVLDREKRESEPAS
ncbi:MAG: DUF1385 domain-containing protein [Coriobacteriia bacterium]|nr:DUF1385 domain-containing protein [Coriobacteriia bacterium]